MTGLRLKGRSGEVTKFRSCPMSTNRGCAHADGSYRRISVAGFGITRDDEGYVVRLVGTMVDVTERKPAEEALEPS